MFCLQGALRVGRYNTFEGWVSSESVGQDILISGRVDMNRALDGDSVRNRDATLISYSP